MKPRKCYKNWLNYWLSDSEAYYFTDPIWLLSVCPHDNSRTIWDIELKFLLQLLGLKSSDEFENEHSSSKIDPAKN